MYFFFFLLSSSTSSSSSRPSADECCRVGHAIESCEYVMAVRALYMIVDSIVLHGWVRADMIIGNFLFLRWICPCIVVGAGYEHISIRPSMTIIIINDASGQRDLF